METQIQNFWIAGFFLPAINATVFIIQNNWFCRSKIPTNIESIQQLKQVKIPLIDNT